MCVRGAGERALIISQSVYFSAAASYNEDCATALPNKDGARTNLALFVQYITQRQSGGIAKSVSRLSIMSLLYDQWISFLDLEIVSPPFRTSAQDLDSGTVPRGLRCETAKHK